MKTRILRTAVLASLVIAIAACPEKSVAPDSSTLLAAFEATTYFTTVPPLIVTELMYHPPAPSSLIATVPHEVARENTLADWTVRIVFAVVRALVYVFVAPP